MVLSGGWRGHPMVSFMEQLVQHYGEGRMAVLGVWDIFGTEIAIGSVTN